MAVNLDIAACQLVAIRRYRDHVEGYHARDELYLDSRGRYLLRHTSRGANDLDHVRPLSRAAAECWLQTLPEQIVWLVGDRVADVIPFPSQLDARRVTTSRKR